MFATTAVLRDPGLNVAYWNLHSGTYRGPADGSVQVGDRPLRFFHFSGFDVELDLTRNQVSTKTA